MTTKFFFTSIAKQPIYAGDIQSDVHSSKRKSERLKQKNKMSRLKISQGGFVRPTWNGDENDPRTNAYVGISNGMYKIYIVKAIFVSFLFIKCS